MIKFTQNSKMYARSMMDIRDKRLIPTIQLFEILANRYPYKVLHWNILHGNAPSYLCKLFSENDTIHNHNTRNSQSLHLPQYKLATGQRTFNTVTHNFGLA